MRNFINAALKKTEKLAPEEKVSIYEKLLKNISEDDDFMVMVLDSLSTGIIISDANNRIIFINKYLAKLVRLKKTDILDANVWEVISDQPVSDFIKESLTSNQKRASKVFNYNIEDKNFAFEVRIFLLKHASGKTGYMINIENVTDRENEKSKKKRAESFASLTALTAGVAHELKNPLGSMSIYLQLLERQLSKKDAIENLDAFKESLKSKVKVLSSEVERLNDIVVDFLSTVRPRTANLQPEELNDIIKDSVQIMLPELEKYNIEVKLDLEKNLPVLMLDRGFIHQVLANLIANAKDSMKENGNGILTITTEKNSDFVILSVSDTGTGISDENLSKIFDPYFTTKKSGTGIGLTLVYKIIKGFGGDITVSSKLGVGTTFHITLPRIEKEIKQIEWEIK